MQPKPDLTFAKKIIALINLEEVGSLFSGESSSTFAFKTSYRISPYKHTSRHVLRLFIDNPKESDCVYSFRHLLDGEMHARHIRKGSFRCYANNETKGRNEKIPDRFLESKVWEKVSNHLILLSLRNQ